MSRGSEHHQTQPRIIQGGMGVGISGWKLAGTVTAAGQLGVVSGAGLEVVYARRLQAGDPGGHARRAFSRFPVPAVVERVLDRYFVPGGLPPGERGKPVPMYTATPSAELQALSVLTNFAEVALAKERGGGGPVGINYLYKIQMPLLASLYGAILAGVDTVIIGAGNPRDVPEALDGLARSEDVSLPLKVFYAPSGERHRIHFRPREVLGETPPGLRRPRFLAIVSSVDQAEGLLHGAHPPDGFVFEAATAGGHNAPPRGPRRLTTDGEPQYGARDELELDRLRSLDRPFWLAGGHGSARALVEARRAGAAGVQVGTAFAFCRESGLRDDLKRTILEQVRSGHARVFTDPRASPTGFPFKVVQVPGTLSSDSVYQARRRVCDLGFLRAPYLSKKGQLGYRCPAEATRIYERKRGRPAHLEGRKCLCNALMANIGLGQSRAGDEVEAPLVTAGDDLFATARYLRDGADSYGAADVIDDLLALDRGACGPQIGAWVPMSKASGPRRPPAYPGRG